jgi:DNA modification methylase
MDVLKGLSKIEDNSIDTIITSPPYWGLRDNHVEGQYGLEDHPQIYVGKIAGIFDEVKRVLKPTGSVWLNLGDAYYTKSGSNFKSSDQMKSLDETNEEKGMKRVNDLREKHCDGKWLQSKQRLMIPSRVAIEMQNRGWILRNDCIWKKTCSMPSSARDRLKNTFEYFFHFVKFPKYYYDLEKIKVPMKQISITRAYAKEHPEKRKDGDKNIFAVNVKSQIEHNKKIVEKINDGVTPMVNPGDVWTIGPKPYKGSHFSVFPPELVRRPLLATCPTQVCSLCGYPRIPKYKTTGFRTKEMELALQRAVKETGVPRQTLGLKYPSQSKTEIIGFDECDCENKSFVPGVVLDPFCGSGTSLMVAKELGLRGRGIELNKDYIPLILERLGVGKGQTSFNPDLVTVITE